ncbi:MAG: hypothetical protein KAT70_03060 [Thermoplasmata archaeon]|nr:hypothetical protein [Thermoplasmata archaeon]
MPMYDLGDLANRLAEHGGLLCNPTTAGRVSTLLDQCVVACAHGEDFRMGEHPDATGMTIYMPYRSTNYNALYDSTRFAGDTTWNEVLREVTWV